MNDQMANLVLSTTFRLPLCLDMDAHEIEKFCMMQDEFVLEAITAMRDAALTNMEGLDDSEQLLRSVNLLHQVLSTHSAESDQSFGWPRDQVDECCLACAREQV